MVLHNSEPAILRHDLSLIDEALPTCSLSPDRQTLCLRSSFQACVVRLPTLQHELITGYDITGYTQNQFILYDMRVLKHNVALARYEMVGWWSTKPLSIRMRLFPVKALSKTYERTTTDTLEVGNKIVQIAHNGIYYLD